MTLMTGAFVQEALRSHIVHMTGHLPSTLAHVRTDSRAVTPGDIFFAVVGEQLDGHAFVESACAKGAALLVVHQAVHLPTKYADRAVMQVDNTLSALHTLARHYLAEMPAVKVALTGSCGKTTTKAFIECALKEATSPEAVFVSRGNLNNHFGVPMMAFEVQPHHSIAVFEMGMNHAGEIAQLAHIVQPHIGLITNIGHAHAGELGGIEGVAAAKGELFEALQSQDIAIVNLDDPRCVAQADQKAPKQQITFGTHAKADVRYSDVHQDPNGVAFQLDVKGQRHLVHLHVLGLHNAGNAASAIAVALALGLDVQKAIAGLVHMQAVTGRLQQHQLKNGIILLNDAYNANPQSMLAGLETLRAFTGHRLIAVVGDMLEQGSDAVQVHRDIGIACAQKGVHQLFACGDMAHEYINGAQSAGMSADKTLWQSTSQALAPFVTQALLPGDVVWVKGSNSINMEHVVRHILETVH